MNQYLSIFNGFVTAGVVQALAASWFMGRRPAKENGIHLLRALLVVLGVLALKILLHTLGGWQTPGLRYFPLAIDTLVSPLFFLYTCSLTTKESPFSSKQWPHMVLPALFMAHALVVYGVTVGVGDLAAKDALAARLGYNTVKWVEDAVTLVVALLYWRLSWRKVRRYRQWLFAHESATRYQELTWLRNLLLATAVLILVLAISSLAANIFHWQGSFYYLLVFYAYLIVLIYYLSYRGAGPGWRGYEQAVPDTVASTNGVLPSLPVEQEVPAVHLSEQDSNLQERLLTLMQEQKPYLDPELNLANLAMLVKAPAAQVSQVINSSQGQNFRNWVNGYRVEEVKQRLIDPAFAHLNMTGIAFDCGFNSEASFYRIFRQFTGQSPKSYSASLAKEK